MTLKTQFTNTNWFSRKLIIAVVLFISASLFLAFGKCTMAEWMTYTEWIFGIYGSTNVVGHGAEALTKK